MKKLSSVFFMWMGFAFAILAVLSMFLPCFWFDGRSVQACAMFWGGANSIGAWPSFVGYMLILVGAIMMGIMALPMVQPTAKTEKVVLILAGLAIFVGIVLAMLIKVFVSIGYNIPLDSNRFGLPGTTYRAGMYITLGFGVISIVMNSIAIKLDW